MDVAVGYKLKLTGGGRKVLDVKNAGLAKTR